MKKVFLIAYIGILLISCNEIHKKNFFLNMHSHYFLDSLTSRKEEFKEFGISERMIKIGNKEYIRVNTSKKSLIPFGGLLRYSNDTIYYLNSLEKGAQEQVLFNFSSKRFTTWYIIYQKDKSDSVTYMGKMYDKYKNDSIDFFMFKPIKRINSSQHSYMKFVEITKDGIESISFESSIGMQTIQMDKYLKVRYEEKYGDPVKVESKK